MKNFLNFCILGLMFFLGIKSLGAINIELNSYNFYGPSPYTEIYLRCETSDLEIGNDSLNSFVALECLLLISNEQNDIIAYDKFVLRQEVTDVWVDMLDVKRFKLPQGHYSIRLEVKDFNKPISTVELIKKWNVAAETAVFSDIIPLAIYKKLDSDHPLAKNGIYIEPLPYHYADTTLHQLDFYIEVYASADSLDRLLMYEIMPDGHAFPPIAKYKKLKNNRVEALILSLPLQDVVSGKYSVELSFIDKEKNKLVSTRTDLTVSNVKADIKALESYNSQFENSFVQALSDDEMDYILKAHLPITDQHQSLSLKEILKRGSARSKKQFIYQLWETKIPENPEEGFKKYMEVARAVDKRFYIAAGHGFQSDRGHIFLKYGKPSNIITIDTETDAYPYEIWYYNYLPLTGQTNVRFLFYNPTLSNSDFVLLHSTCYGERMDPTWEQQIYKSALNADMRAVNVDNPEVPEGWNRQARRYFNEY